MKRTALEKKNKALCHLSDVTQPGVYLGQINMTLEIQRRIKDSPLIRSQKGTKVIFGNI